MSVALWGCVLGCSPAQGQGRDTNRDYKLFVCAMSSISTNPLYVLITVVDGRSEQRQQVAISSDALRSAIRNEYGIPLGSELEAIEIALRSHDRMFTFHNERALACVQPGYSPALLSDIRNLLADLTNDELIDAVGEKIGPRGEIMESPLLDALYKAYEDDQRGCNAAMAHALLERQILCGVGGCFNGGIYIRE